MFSYRLLFRDTPCGLVLFLRLIDELRIIQELLRHTPFQLTSDCCRRYLKGKGSVKRSAVLSRLRTHSGRVVTNPEPIQNRLPGD